MSLVYNIYYHKKNQLLEKLLSFIITYPKDHMTHVACYQCKNVFSISREGLYLCPHCGSQNQFGNSQNIAKVPPYWDANYKTELFKAFFETIKAVLTNPVYFFRTTLVNPDLLPALWFAVGCQIVSFLFAAIYQSGFSVLEHTFLTHFATKVDTADLTGLLFTPIFYIVLLVLSPVIAIIQIILSTSITHFILWILRGAEKGFMHTFHVVCYSRASLVLSVVPFMGVYIAAIWSWVNLIIGLKETHDIPYWKSVLTTLIPTLLCCCLIFFSIFAVLILLTYAKNHGYN